MSRFGLIGCGNMGSAMAKAAACSLPDCEFTLFDSDPRSREKLAAEIGASAADSVESAVAGSDISILAVKPQVLPALYPSLAACGANRKWISIAAGVSLETLSRKLESSQIVRLMPNIAASVHRAVTALVSGSSADPDFVARAEAFARASGEVIQLPEAQFPAFIGISGSAIAFFYQFIHALALGGTMEGIAYPKAVEIAASTCAGAIELLKRTAKEPQKLITEVTSAGGTTIEGILALERGGLTPAIIEAVMAASRKAVLLEQRKPD